MTTKKHRDFVEKTKSHFFMQVGNLITYTNAYSQTLDEARVLSNDEYIELMKVLNKVLSKRK